MARPRIRAAVYSDWLDSMSIQALVWVIEHSQSRLADRCVLMSIANHCDREGKNAWPSINTISHEAKVSPRQVQISIVRLSKTGELSVARSRGPHGTNLYSLPMMTEGNPTLLAEIPESDKRGEKSAGAQNLRGECFSSRVQNLTRKPHDSAPEPSLEPSQEPSFHSHLSSDKRQQDNRHFEHELHDMRRRGGIGKATRDLWRERLKDPSELAKVPEWFRREAGSLLNDCTPPKVGKQD